MESAMEVDEKKELLDELTEAQELATQLHAIFDQPSPVMGSQLRPLTQRLLQCIKSAISMATKSPTTSDCEESPDLFQAQSSAVLSHFSLESPHLFEAQSYAALSHFSVESPSPISMTTSSASEMTTGSAIPAKVGLRRKAMERSRSIRVRAGESLDDGHVWRKYGQKDILGSKYPRGYYRCTYKNEFGCRATKQVQRDHDDPEILHVTYLGSHTCLQSQLPSSKPFSQLETTEAALQPPHDSEFSDCISETQRPTDLQPGRVGVSASTTEAEPETPRRFQKTCGGDDERDVGNW